MIRCWVELGDGSSLWLPAATRWKFSYGTGVPCDSFELRCLWEPGQEKKLSAAALFFAQWGEERVFTGVVDEFACVCDGGGTWLELSGRGMAARLLDNEALPMEYQKCTRDDLVADHVAPYGLTAVGGRSLAPMDGFVVESGQSEWSVVWDFVCCHGGIVPCFDRKGRLVLDGHKDDAPLVIDHRTAVTGWEYREDRHGVLSAVGVRQRSSGTLQWARDRAFIAQGGCARRIVTMPEKTDPDAMRMNAQYRLRASRAERVRLTITLPGPFSAWPGQLVEVDRAGIAGRYRVAQAEVSCTARGTQTVLTLGEPDSMI